MNRCVVCKEPIAAGAGTYLSYGTPPGSYACEGQCTHTADARFRAGQRVDGKGPLHAPGRNEPCPCGSGKKYKKCHMKGDAKPLGCDAPECPDVGLHVSKCSLCAKRYVSCRRHAAKIAETMQGHIVRVHPERIENKVIDAILDNRDAMAVFEQERARAADLWTKFFERLDARRAERGGVS